MTKYAWKSVPYRSGEQASVVASTLAEAEVAAQLAKGPVVVIVGKANVAESHRFQMDALANVLAAVPAAKVLPAFRRGNVNGALRLGFQPSEGGMYTTAMLEAAAAGKLACLILVGVDPFGDHPDHDLVQRALGGVRSIIAVDAFVTASSARADVVLPAAVFAEKAGTTTNLEGRVTTLQAKVNPAGTARPDWMIAAELADRLGEDLGFASVESITDAIADRVPAFAGLTAAALAAAPDGLLVDRPGTGSLPAPGPAAKEPNGYAHRLVTSRKLYDKAVFTQLSPSMANLAPGASIHVHSLDLDRLGARGGTQLKVTGPRGSVILAAVADDGVPRGQVWVPFNQPGVNIAVIIDSGDEVCDVTLESLPETESR
ncbi:MAG: molybdopterin-dependent oxidoreductase [Ilumatobacteraceae bacterium]